MWSLTWSVGPTSAATSQGKLPAPGEVSLKQPWQSSKDPNNEWECFWPGVSAGKAPRGNGKRHGWLWVKQQPLGFVKTEDKTWQMRKRQRKAAWELEKTKLQVLFLKDCCFDTFFLLISTAYFILFYFPSDWRPFLGSFGRKSELFLRAGSLTMRHFTWL